MKKIREIQASTAIIFFVLISLALTPAYAVSQSSTPSLRSSSANYAVSTSVSCKLEHVHAGDELFATVQSSGVAQTTMTAKDNFRGSFAYYTNWSFGTGMGAAYAKASSSGTVKLKITVGNAGAGLSLFCYDISGVQNSLQASGGLSLGGGTALSASPLTLSPNSFVVALWSSYYSPTASITGTGFQFTNHIVAILGEDGNYISAEYAPLVSGTTTCPMTTTTSQGWGGLCFAFPRSS